MCQMADDFGDSKKQSTCIIYCVNGGPISQIEAINMRCIIANVDLPKENDVVFEIVHGELPDFVKFVHGGKGQTTYDKALGLVKQTAARDLAEQAHAVSKERAELPPLPPCNEPEPEPEPTKSVLPTQDQTARDKKTRRRKHHLRPLTLIQALSAFVN